MSDHLTFGLAFQVASRFASQRLDDFLDHNLTQRVAARYKMSYFNAGDHILYGKFKNKRGILKRVFLDDRNIPMIEIEPVPKGRKKNRVMGLYTIRKAAPPEILEEG